MLVNISGFLKNSYPLQCYLWIVFKIFVVFSFTCSDFHSKLYNIYILIRVVKMIYSLQQLYTFFFKTKICVHMLICMFVRACVYTLPIYFELIFLFSFFLFFYETLNLSWLLSWLVCQYHNLPLISESLGSALNLGY